MVLIRRRMNRIMKKIVCLVLVLVLCMASAVPAFAREDEWFSDDGSENTINDGYPRHFLVFSADEQTITIENELQIDGLNAVHANGSTLIVRGKLYSEHCLFFVPGYYFNIVLEENGVIDLANIERDIDLDWDALRAKGYCVYYEDNHLIISYKHRDAEVCGSCSFCHRECNHPFDDYVFDDTVKCGHCGHGIMGDETNYVEFINDPKSPGKEYTVYGIQNYDAFMIKEDVSVLIDKDAQVNIRNYRSMGNLVIYGSVNITNSYDGYAFDGDERIFLKGDGVFECNIPDDYGDTDSFIASLHKNGAECLSLDGNHLHASVKHHYDWDGVCNGCGKKCTHEKLNGAVCAECGNIEDHECLWNDGVCTLCGAKCEDHYFDANGVCLDCGHVRTLEDTLQDWISEDLVIPEGKYTVWDLRIKPGVTVTVEKGAELRFTGGISTVDAKLVIRGKVIGFTGGNCGDKEVGTVVLEDDGVIEIFSYSPSPVGVAGFGREFVDELKNDNTVKCTYYFDMAGFLHFANNHSFGEDGECIFCGKDANYLTGSIIASGTWWIIAVVALIIVGGVVAIIVTRKKKPLVANREITDDVDAFNSKGVSEENK